MSRANPRYKRVNPPGTPVGTGSVVEYIIQGSIESQLTINTFYYQAATPLPSTAQLNTLLTALHTNLYALYIGCLSSDWTTTRELLNVVDINSLQGVISVGSAGTAGTRPAGHFPTEVAAILIKRTALKGQHGRGRISLPAISLGDATASTITLGAAKTAQLALCTAMLLTASDGTNTWTPCVAQRNTASPRLVVAYANLTAVAPNYVLGTVRRRKLGRGK